jgi:hypothetical protein
LLDGVNKYKCEWCVLFTLLWKFLWLLTKTNAKEGEQIHL